MSRKGEGVVNVERRKWDRDEFAKRAQERALRENEELAALQRGGKQASRALDPEVTAPDGSKVVPGSKRAFLEGRQGDLKIDDRVGKYEVVNTTATLKPGGGYWCEVCQCLLKDSMAYLAHVNGKRHQRLQGYSMRVERSTVSAVRNRLQAHKRRREEQAGASLSSLDEYERRVAMIQEDEEQRKRQRREEKRRQRKERKGLVDGGGEDDGRDGGSDGEDQEGAVSAHDKAGSSPSVKGETGGAEDAGEDDGAEDKIAAMMGISGFGGSRKNG